MTTTSPEQQDQVIACLRAIRESLDRLESLLGTPQEPTLERLYRRRKELLARIYASGGMARDVLFQLLDEHETPHQWIGQQIKSGYLEKFPRPTGHNFYAVTHKAVQELGLHAEAEAFASVSQETLAADWDSTEDAAYDQH